MEKAIHTANIPHVAPQRIDARTIRIPIPKYAYYRLFDASSQPDPVALLRPTVEMRTTLLASASKIAENTRIQVRAAREEGMKDLKKAGFAKDTKQAKEVRREPINQTCVAHVLPVFADTNDD